MRLSKPCSFISYNSKSFLIMKLKQFKKDGLIEFWCFIRHEAEKEFTGDECSGKPHFHVYIIPAKLIQTEDLRKLLEEPDPTSDKPLGAMPFRKSDWTNWYLYSLHDPDYLLSKGLIKEYHYEIGDFVTSDDDYLKVLVSEIDCGKISPYRTMEKYIVMGVSFVDYMIANGIDIRYTHQYEKAWKNMATQIYRERKAVKNDSGD